MPEQVLVCDFSRESHIGFALAEPGRRPGASTAYSCFTKAEFEQGLDAFMAAHGNPDLKGAAISARGFEEDGRIHRIGDGLEITRDDFRSRLGIQRVNLVNCFVARALAVPKLRRGERAVVSAGESSDETVTVVLGPNYGLGNASLISDGAGNWTSVPGEGGHSSLAARNEREWQVIRALKRLRGNVVRETALSQQGFRDMWTVLHEIDGRTAPEQSVAAIIALARASDPVAREIIALTTAWLADMAADIALILSATSGVYLSGALMDQIGDLLDADAFHARFAGESLRRPLLEKIPVWRTLAAEMELIGLATLYD